MENSYTDARKRVNLTGEIVSVLYPSKNSHELYSVLIEVQKSDPEEKKQNQTKNASAKNCDSNNYIVELKFNSVKTIAGIQIGNNIRVEGTLSKNSSQISSKGSLPQIFNPKYELL